MKVNRDIQGTHADRLGSRTHAECGRCGIGMHPARRNRKPYCKDCRKSDPQFCQ